MNKHKVYMNIAHEIKHLSHDLETQVGAVMLSPEGRIIATSYNGFVRSADDEALPRIRPDKYQYMQHAERNLIYNCAYEGIRTKGTTIYSTLSPCLECVRACFQAGVSKIIFDELYHKFPNVNHYVDIKDIWIDVEKIDSYTCLELSEVYP